MYHITKTKSKEKPFSVVNLSDNGEVLSDHPLKTKQACFKNVMAVMNEVKLEGDMFQIDVKVHAVVQDDTVNPVRGWKVSRDDYQKKYDHVPAPRYIPGKNPNKKKKSAKK